MCCSLFRCTPRRPRQLGAVVAHGGSGRNNKGWGHLSPSRNLSEGLGLPPERSAHPLLDAFNSRLARPTGHRMSPMRSSVKPMCDRSKVILSEKRWWVAVMTWLTLQICKHAGRPPCNCDRQGSLRVSPADTAGPHSSHHLATWISGPSACSVLRVIQGTIVCKKNPAHCLV